MAGPATLAEWLSGCSDFASRVAHPLKNRVGDVDVVHDVDEDAVGDAVDIVRDVGDVDYACDVDEVDVDGCR